MSHPKDSHTGRNRKMELLQLMKECKSIGVMNNKKMQILQKSHAIDSIEEEMQIDWSDEQFTNALLPKWAILEPPSNATSI
jgi:hypothetical protein